MYAGSGAIYALVPIADLHCVVMTGTGNTPPRDRVLTNIESIVQGIY